MYKLIPLFFLFLPSFVFAQSALQIPEGEVILEVTGNISVTNEDEYAIFDQEMIDQLSMHTISTNNHISEAKNKYTGIHFYNLLMQLGAKGSIVNITAWDDYVVQIKMEDLKKYDVLLATHENGVRLTINDKGPMFVVFPFSDFEEIRRDDYYNKSIWQVRSIEVK